MNLTLLLACWLCTPIPADTPAESIAVVNLRECLNHAPSSVSDRQQVMQSIIDADAEAKQRYEALTKSKAKAKLEGSTELERTNAKLLKYEFEAFRHGEQDRLRKAEQDMFKKWHKQVNAAVKTVAERDGFTIVLYIGEDTNETEVAVTEPLQILTRNHAGYVLNQERTNITKKIVAEMSTDAFVDAIGQ